MQEFRDFIRSRQPVNLIIVFVNIVVFVALSFLGDTEDVFFMTAHGANFAPLVTEGKGNGNFAALLPVVLLAAVGIGGFLMLSSSKKKFQQVKPDPDADYQEDDDFDLPEDSYDEE